ncbi:MAG: TIGR01212 family radical SAM protein [Bacteroidales bacterium]|jgi:radical SAM protein (TIGR01212 family)|nr:TIGR01212 family radical SAM protein [Bacteroidales bacterium]MDX9926161.1 TIGR01212 family radical SAM protein [Bacteroidales bacterium]HNX83464.1 TIGR01212 family radical SAM protein [Bacteroidales bacterium]HOC48665.1 TIGR01212 family radical SAM protein [Bacteroidales bacterium]HPS98389.1 TIGR01212 family radical SAM protein [Bacteroidales bacterium]
MNGEQNYVWGTARRYNSYADWFAGLFGGRVQKLSINAGFTCPNRDGTLGYGGCTYCNNEAFIPGYCTPEKSVTDQIEQGIAFHRRRYRRAERYIAYFQAYTNTYADIDKLTALYDEALNHPSVAGLVIGTRPDCINGELLDRLAVMARDYFVMIEYGIESVNDDILRRINRGHDFTTAMKALKETELRGLNAGAHLIFGLPGESRSAIADSAEVISSLPLTSLKIRQLQLIKGTAMAMEYRKNPGAFDLYDLEEYLDLVITFTERLSPGIMIDRISGEAPPRLLDDPRDWHLRSSELFRLFEHRLEERNTWQGRLCKMI